MSVFTSTEGLQRPVVLTSTSEACAREHKSAEVNLKSKVVRTLAS